MTEPKPAESPAKTPVLLLRSTSRNFPLDLAPELERAGHPVSALEGLEEFIASPARSAPFLAVMEIGTTSDLERAHLVFEWVEQMQPLAPARYLLLLGSKNLPLGQSAQRFGTSAEIATLPQPARNLLFKLELQSRLLRSAPKAEARRGKGFSAQVEQVSAAGKPRLLVARGPDEKAGSWKQGDASPQGKIRWRWVRQLDPKAPEAKEQFAWIAESDTAPVFDKPRDAWLVEGEEVNLLCQRQGSTVFSAVPLPGAPPKAANAAPENSEALAVTATAKEGGDGVTEPSYHDRRGHSGSAKAENSEASPREAAARAEKKEPEKPPPALRPEKEVKEPAAPAQPAQPAPENDLVKAALALRDQALRKVRDAKSSSESAPEAGQEKPAAPAAAASAELASGKPAHARAEAAPRTAVPWGVKTGAAATATASATAAGDAPRQGAEEEFPSVKSDNDDENGRSETLGSLSESSLPRDEAQAAAAKQSISIRGAPAGRALGHVSIPGALEGGARAGTTIVEEAAKAAPEGSERVGGSESKAPEPVRMAEGEDPGLSGAVSNAAGESQSAPVPTSLVEADLAARTSTSTIPANLFDSELPPLSGMGSSKPQIAAAAPQVETRFKGALSEEPGNAMLGEGAKERAALTLGERAARESREGNDLNPGTAPARESPTIAEKAPAEAPSGMEHDSRRFLRDRFFLLMTLAELADKQSSWHPVGGYRIYLAAQHRYYGLPHPGDVLPLWIYEGELAPEFIDERKSWKFYDRLPVAIFNLEGLPLEVLEYVYKMAGQPLPEKWREKGIAKEKPHSSSTSKSENAENAAAGEKESPAGDGGKKKTSAWGALVSTVKKVLKGS